MQIFGKSDLVEPGEIPDFSEWPVYKLISFFREAKFEPYVMLPFQDQYNPTNTGNEESDAVLRADKEAADAEGKTWTSKYLFHIPLQVGTRPKVLDESQQDSTASLGSQTIHSHQTLDGSI